MEKERKERALVLLLLGFCLFGAARKLLGAQKTVIQKTNLKKNIIKRRKTSKGIKTTKTKRKNPRTETELYIRHAKGRRKKKTPKKKEQQQKLHLYFALNKITSGQPEPQPVS